MKYKGIHPLPSHLSHNFLSNNSYFDSITLFDKEFILEKSNFIFTSSFPDEIDESLISINNYLKKYPNETINVLFQINFFDLLFSKLDEGEKSYSSSIFLLFNNAFLIAPPEILDDFLSNEKIFYLLNFMQQYYDNHELFCLILDIFSSLLEKYPEISKLLLQNDIWKYLIDFEQQTSYLNKELYSNLIEYDKIKFSTAHNELEKIELEEKQQNLEEEEESNEQQNLIEEEEEEEESNEQRIAKLVELMQDQNRYNYYLYMKNKKKKMKERKKEIRKRNNEKRRLLQIIEKEDICKYRITFFKFLSKLIKSDYELPQETFLINDLFNIFDSNFFQNQIKEILISILEILDFISDIEFNIFIENFEKIDLSDRFLKINLIDDKMINQYGLLILDRIIEKSFSKLNYFYFEEILQHFQNSLVLDSFNSQSEKNAVLLLEIIQKYESITDYYQILNTSGTLRQISTLMKNSKYGVCSEAFKTFFSAIQSTSNEEFIDLLQKSPVIETCIEFTDSENQDCLFFALNIILHFLEILNCSNDLDYIFDSFEQKCDFEDFISLTENENEDVAELASLIMAEIEKWQQDHIS